MKIFVTGAAGFLGSHLCERFMNKGHQVVGVDNFIGGYEDNVIEGVEFHKWDLSNINGLSELMKDCDVVYHTACTAYEGLSVFSPSLVGLNTFQISVNTMTAAIQAGVSRFVHCSSMARYGTQEVIPFTENLECKPQDPYGIAKFSAELMLKNLALVHGIDLVIAIPHNIVGPRQKYDDPFRNVASIMINLMLQDRQPVIYGDGEQIRCFSDVEDDLDVLEEMAFSKDAVGDVFNIGPDENPVTINKLAIVIADLIKFDLKPIYMEGRPQEVKIATCSADKIRKTFGYSTKVGLEESLNKMIDYVKKRGVRPFEYHLPLEIISEKTPKTWTQKLF